MEGAEQRKLYKRLVDRTQTFGDDTMRPSVSDESEIGTQFFGSSAPIYDHPRAEGGTLVRAAPTQVVSGGKERAATPGTPLGPPPPVAAAPGTPLGPPPPHQEGACDVAALPAAGADRASSAEGALGAAGNLAVHGHGPSSLWRSTRMCMANSAMHTPALALGCMH